MAIYGAGSNWDGDEMKEEFFKNNNFIIGWNINEAQDLYNLISTMKAGDIVYLKANKPGSLDIRIKGIGIVKSSLIQILFKKGEDLSINRKNFELPVEWIYKQEYVINIPNDTGKLTNIRAATLYEEHLPFVHDDIIAKTISAFK
jgi:hypothetical protein